MNVETTPLQYDIFSGELVDTRTASQKRQAKPQLQQTELFSIHDTLQIGVNHRPWLSAMPAGPLVLESEDIRTEEEIAAELRREAEKLTTPLFAETTPDIKLDEAAAQTDPATNTLLDAEAPDYRVALLHLGHAELLAACPDKKASIQQLKDTDIETIACNAENALHQIYQMVLQITLSQYLTERPITQHKADS